MKSFFKKGYQTAQILLTVEGLHQRDTYLNARNTINALLSLGTIPVVNENDTVATEEIRFGDNDTLSAQVAFMTNSDLLIILSDVDGFCVTKGKKKEVMHVVDAVDEGLKEHVHKVKKGRTVGGMESKLDTGFMMMKLGLPLLIANGNEKDILTRIVSGEEVGTLFVPTKKRQDSKKRWLAFTATLPTAGSIVVDEGAYKALSKRGKSLLASGVVGANGEFRFGDAVKIVNHENKEFAKGITNFSSSEMSMIAGKKTSELKAALGAVRYDEVVHYDNMIILD